MFNTEKELIQIVVAIDQSFAHPYFDLERYLEWKWNGRIRNLLINEHCFRLWNKIEYQKLKDLILEEEKTADYFNVKKDNSIWNEVRGSFSYLEDYEFFSQQNLTILVLEYFQSNSSIPLRNGTLRFFDEPEKEIIYQTKLIYSSLDNNNKFRDDWKSETVVNLANQIYQNKQWDLMPILADALQDEGCDQPILDHMRNPESRFSRGCWILDKILDKRS